MEDAHQTRFFPKGEKVGFASYLLRDRARDQWEEFGHALGTDAVVSMSWVEFLTRFHEEFAPIIEVQQMVREFQDLHHTTEAMAEITAKFRERALLVLQYHDMLKDEIRDFLSYSG